jgi:S-adenosylmethionine synthetase
MINNFMFTSQSVTEGHPDKMCDQISDAVVDHILSQSHEAQVRCECAISNAIIFIAASFASEAVIDFSRLARNVIRRIGYDSPEFSPKTCSILSSPKALPVGRIRRFDERTLSNREIDSIPAKNQVTVFGYACSESPVCLPLPIYLAHRLARKLTEVRKNGTLPYLMPDAKVHVGVSYEGRTPKRIHSITMEIHTQNPDKPGQTVLAGDIAECVITPAFETVGVRPDAHTLLNINPDGPYAGGPANHSGVTGRKKAMDNYGEFTRHSGKALSGKDPLRVDRCGTYAARFVAKNLLAAGLADPCEVMVSYGTGLAQPVSLMVNSFGSAPCPDTDLIRLVEHHFDLRPAAILKRFELRHLPARHPEGFYQHLAAYGHFGREDLALPWEQTDMAALLAAAASSPGGLSGERGRG